MRHRPLALALVIVIVTTLPLAGCDREGPRTSQRALQGQLSRTYKIADDTRRQLARGRRAPRVITAAKFACRPIGPEPGAERDWPWNCVVVATGSAGSRRTVAQYGVEVDVRGCFEARSGSVARRVRETALDGRLVRNPLRRFFGCGG